MALGRNYLKGMGLNDEQVDAVIEAHVETVDALKEEIASYKEKAEKATDLQKELEELKKNSAGDGEWKQKYEKEHKAFDDFKKNIEVEKSKEAKVTAYKALLKEANVSEKLIDLVVKANAADIDALELDEKGAIKTAEELKKTIATDYADYITDSQTKGAGTENPPGTSGGNEKDLGSLSMEEYIAARTKK